MRWAARSLAPSGRALGAGDAARAQSLGLAAFVIGAGASLGFALLIWLLGPTAYRALGGAGESLEAATLYSNIAALAVVGIWTTNTMASVARGSGAMAAPAFFLLGAGLVQIAFGGGLAFGFGSLPCARLRRISSIRTWCITRAESDRK